jgi:hypothetical protein
MEIKLTSMQRELEPITPPDRSLPKSLALSMRECFDRYFNRFPYETDLSRQIKYSEIFWKTRLLTPGNEAFQNLPTRPPLSETVVPPRHKPDLPKAAPESETLSRMDHLLQNIMATLDSLKTRSVVQPEPPRVAPPPPPTPRVAPPQPEPRPERKTAPLSSAPTHFKRKELPAYVLWGTGVGIVLGVLFLGKALIVRQTLDRKTPLPYAHVIGPIMSQNKIYCADWFRSNLYVHKIEKGLPIVAAENIPNSLVTGLAVTNVNLWTIDGVANRILQHALTPEHLVLHSYPTPGTRPRGLFFDGIDLWSGDAGLQIIYRHQGTDVTAIKDQYHFNDVALTSFQIYRGSVWILDKSERKISAFNLQKEMVIKDSFDLTPFLEGAEPRGFTLNETGLIVATENPTSALFIDFSKAGLPRLNPRKIQ